MQYGASLTFTVILRLIAGVKSPQPKVNFTSATVDLFFARLTESSIGEEFV